MYVGRDPGSGKQIQRTKTFRADGIRAAEKAAVGARAELLDEIRRRKKNAGTLAALLDRYGAWKVSGAGKPWAASTAKRNMQMLTVIRKDLGRLDLVELTALHIDDWYATLAGRGLAAKTIGHYGRLLNGALRQGQRWGLVTARATENATLPQADPPAVQPPTDAVVQLLVGTARGPLRVSLLVAALTGLRRGEIVGLRWSDLAGSALSVRRSVLDLQAGPPTVKVPKTRGSVRTIEVHELLLAELEVWRVVQAGQFAQLGARVPVDCFVLADLAADPTGQTPRRPGWLSQAWGEHRKKHGARAVRLHDLRHWHATMLLNRGVPITTVSKRLGHSKVTTTMNVYAHAEIEGDELAAQVVGQVLALEA